MLVLPSVSLEAVIKRQILEGVQAVVKLHRSSQFTGKIPLQLFDKTGGADNVRFEGSYRTSTMSILANQSLEYDELEVRVAAELVIRAKAKHIAAPLPSQNPYAAGPQRYSAIPYAQAPLQPPTHQQAVATAGQPNIANLITSLDGPALQKLLGAMQQNPQTAQTPQPHMPLQSPTHNQNLSALLGNAGLQQHQVHSQQNYNYPPNQALQQLPSNFQYGAPYQPAPQQAMVQQHQQPQTGQHQHVQNIMEQLAKWKQ